MKFVFSPDVISCGWLGSEHQLTNELTNPSDFHVNKPLTKNHNSLRPLDFTLLPAQVFSGWPDDLHDESSNATSFKKKKYIHQPNS